MSFGPGAQRPSFEKMAEREGFEPSKELSPFTRLAGERLQPARPSLLSVFLAEGVGFEPTVPLGTTVFKTASLSHSDIPPEAMPKTSGILIPQK